MKGYKGMDANMQCRGMQYEVGKSYHIDGDIAPCLRGLHFCKNLQDVFGYYGPENRNRFFEIEATRTIVKEGRKFATSDMTLVRELQEKEIKRTCYGNGFGSGNCFGDGYRNGFGDGDVYGNGEYSGRGCGNGERNGNGYGCSNSFFDGSGYGFGFNGGGYGISLDIRHGIQTIMMFD